MSIKKVKDLLKRAAAVNERRGGPVIHLPKDGSRRPKPEPIKAKDIVTQVALDALSAAQHNTLDQLAILRQTRGQRQVGSLKIPPHLSGGTILLDDSGVQTRATRAGGDN